MPAPFAPKRRNIVGLIVFFIFAIFLAGGCSSGDKADVSVRSGSSEKSAAKNANTKYTIYLITMDQGSNFWQLIDSGCRQAVDEIGDVNYKWIAPSNYDVKEQGECIDKAVADNANAIVISAISPDGINENLKKAADAGIKIVYVDSAATYEGVATLMTDSFLAGRIAGETMQKALSESGITSGTIGLAAMGHNQNATLRDEGFRKSFEGTPFTVAPTAYMNNDRQNIKNHVKEHPEYVGFFGSNGQTTFAISEEIKETGRHQIVIGFDTADFTLAMINEGIIYATMQQNPKKMGHDGIDIAVKALNGEFNQTNVKIDMGVNVITRDKI